MRTTITRRRFVGTSLGLAAASGVWPLLGRMAEGAEEKLVVGLRDVHLREIGEKDCWSSLRGVGAEGVEVEVADDLSLPNLVSPGTNYSLADEGSIAKFAADAKAAGVKIPALFTANHFDSRPEFEIDWVTKVARAAKTLGTPAIRIDVVPGKTAGDEFQKLATETLKKLVAATEATGVALAIENHGDTTNRPEFLEKLFKEVGSQRLGLTLDTANFYWFGHPLSKLYDLYESLAPRVHHTHIKSIKYPEASREKRRAMGWEYDKYCCPIYEGDIDFRRVVTILRKAGYKNDLCVEDESLSKFPAKARRDVLSKEVRHLKLILG